MNEPTGTANDEWQDASAGERFNPSALDMLLRVGDGSLLLRMAEIFLKNAPERIQSARDGVDTEDMRAISLASHSLKSSAAQLGGAALQKASLAVESAAKIGDLDAIIGGIESMQTEFDLMRTWLQDQCAKVAAQRTSPDGEESPS
jgi:HPt (histidine-containing phosphotransfer) domain-containing protein